MLDDWDVEMDRQLDKAQQQQDKKAKLTLQRQMAYQRCLEDDEWVDVFFQSIKGFIDLTLLELLKQHITDSAKHLMSEEFKE